MKTNPVAVVVLDEIVKKAEAKIAALQWASKALRSLGTWDAVKAIDERIAALSLPAEPTAEGQLVYPAICLPLVLDLATAKDDLARMIAEVDEWKQRTDWNATLFDASQAELDRMRADAARMKAAMESARMFITEGQPHTALAQINNALKGTST